MTAPEPTQRTVPCPTCRRPAVFAPSNRWRPFCGQRCREIDFGAWAAEDYRVAADAPPDDDPRQPAPRGD
ncbi:MAG: DNA gyrase inhibitor YacG [Burkholderiales bacterium]|nr:DNA gyrase inhibitor YacG [Burkholderiales bacterium]MBP6250562.1 DNA gyrase inhibitor YacG [Leptothrix sp. (in: b-proteobacteria)]MBP7519373.1 DNA gyrase inhibitor YacG [Leptothrix sp. (in: b-proteobacteria)]HQY07789.1 DNA gyrase inhibitor YacG [Burkholderiaceae bacterium]